ncbi:hypothetical protein F4859DRAFT_484961, partial [Xylaria cf. heliscus]
PKKCLTTLAATLARSGVVCKSVTGSQDWGAFGAILHEKSILSWPLVYHLGECSCQKHQIIPAPDRCKSKKLGKEACRISTPTLDAQLLFLGALLSFRETPANVSYPACHLSLLPQIPSRKFKTWTSLLPFTEIPSAINHSLYHVADWHSLEPPWRGRGMHETRV